MIIKTKSTNINLTQELKDYAESKMSSLEKLFSSEDPDSVIVEMEFEGPSGHHRKGKVFRYEVNLSFGGKLIRGEERSEIMTEAIDKVHDEVERQIKKTKSKQKSKFLRGAREFARKAKSFKFKR